MNTVSPVSRLTVTKYSQSPPDGFMTAEIAASPGLEIGPTGSPAFTYVFHGFGSNCASSEVLADPSCISPKPYCAVESICSRPKVS